MVSSFHHFGGFMHNHLRVSSIFPVLTGLFLAVALASAASASKAGSPADSAAIAPPGKHAHMDCMADSSEMAKLRLTVQEALKSGDKGKMKSALEKVDAHIAKMQDAMAKCKGMMDKDGDAMMGNDGEMNCGKEHHAGGSPKGEHH
jgi:hypothetical protein